MNTFLFEEPKQTSKFDANHLCNSDLVEDSNDYRRMPLPISEIDNEGSAYLLRYNWGDVVRTLLFGVSQDEIEAGLDSNLSCWTFQPTRANGLNSVDVPTSGLARAQPIPTSMSALVLDLYGTGPSSYFDDLQHVSYQFIDPLEPDAKKYRLVLPMLTEMPASDFVMLRSTIREWADRHSGDDHTDLGSYETGRIFRLPLVCSELRSGANALYNPGGHILHWPEFEVIKNTGDDMTLI